MLPAEVVAAWFHCGTKVPVEDVIRCAHPIPSATESLMNGVFTPVGFPFTSGWRSVAIKVGATVVVTPAPVGVLLALVVAFAAPAAFTLLTLETTQTNRLPLTVRLGFGDTVVTAAGTLGAYQKSFQYPEPDSVLVERALGTWRNTSPLLSVNPVIVLDAPAVLYVAKPTMIVEPAGAGVVRLQAV